MLNPEMTTPVTSRELFTESILQKSRQLKGDLLEITTETVADLANRKALGRKPKNLMDSSYILWNKFQDYQIRFILTNHFLVTA